MGNCQKIARFQSLLRRSIIYDCTLQIWNDELAIIAQNYAEGCVFRHNPNRSILAPSFDYVGENLAITTSSRVNYTALAELWHNEVIHYNYSTNRCSDVCGHYTQVCKIIQVQQARLNWCVI